MRLSVGLIELKKQAAAAKIKLNYFVLNGEKKSTKKDEKKTKTYAHNMECSALVYLRNSEYVNYADKKKKHIKLKVDWSLHRKLDFIHIEPCTGPLLLVIEVNKIRINSHMNVV